MTAIITFIANTDKGMIRPKDIRRFQVEQKHFYKHLFHQANFETKGKI